MVHFAPCARTSIRGGSAHAGTISDLGIFRKAGSTYPVAKSIYSEEYREFRELLKRLRVEAGIRQVELAARLGVPQSFISKYESGERRLDVVETARIADALGTSLVSIVHQLGAAQ